MLPKMDLTYQNTVRNQLRNCIDLPTQMSLWAKSDRKILEERGIQLTPRVLKSKIANFYKSN